MLTNIIFANGEYYSPTTEYYPDSSAAESYPNACCEKENNINEDTYNNINKDDDSVYTYSRTFKPNRPQINHQKVKQQQMDGSYNFE